MLASIVDPAALEASTQAIGRKLLAATQPSQSVFSQVHDQFRWDDRLLAWTMNNPGLRVQLFRAIDCLPSLRSKAEIARHLQEYLLTKSVELPEPLKHLLNFTQPDAITGQLAATTLTRAVGILARKYIAGETLTEAIKTIERLRRNNLTFTLDVLGEAVLSKREANSYLHGYLDLMAQLTAMSQTRSHIPAIDDADGQPLPLVQISVKLTAFDSQFNPYDASGSRKRVGDRLRILLRRAKELNVAVHFDMEQYAYKDLTLAILKDLLLEDEFCHRQDIGLTIQAYLKDSERDLLDLIDWAKQRQTPVTVRLVKGAYWDQEVIHATQQGWPCPVYREKVETDTNFEHLTQLLLEQYQHLYPAIGSHNVRSQARAIALAHHLEIPNHCFECQVLYGMGDKLAKAIADEGIRVRVYCPYGDLIPGMAYLIRRLLENTANSSFLRQRFSEISPDNLLAPPTAIARPDKAPNPGFANALNTDFSQAEPRQLAQQALQAVQSKLGASYKPLIGGKWIDTGITVPSVNPSRPTEIVGHVNLATVDDVHRAIATAKAASPAWKATRASERAKLLRSIADRLEHQRFNLIAWMVLEVGKTVSQADPEISEAIDFCRYYADEMERLNRGFDRNVLGETNHYLYQPRGIAVVIAPWNFPIAIPLGMTVAALVTGNCTILKPSEQSSVIATKLVEIAVAAGVPDGVLQYLPGAGETIGPALTQHPDVHTITFTGSQAVGCQIYADAARLQPGQTHLKRVIAEMGGKNAIIVDESADLDRAVQGVVASAFGYSGQKCSACSRVIVLEPIYDTFVSRLVEATRSLSVGPADDPSTTVGPVIDADARDRLRAAIETNCSAGTIALEMDAPATGYFIGPTIITEVDPASPLAQQELFGPVLAVITASNFDRALAIANETPYALTGGLYSRTPSHIARARQDFRVGNVYINRGITGAIVNRQAFGGFRLSGVGSKAGGPDYLLQFMDPQVITENIQRQGFAPIDN